MSAIARPVNRHWDQFDAYCAALYDYRAHFDDVELRYLAHVFAAARPDGADAAPFSWKTYGHKIVGDTIASYQLGLGCQAVTPSDIDAIETVLAHWLDAPALSWCRPLLARSRGAGLGWALPGDERRLYCLFDREGPALDLRERPELAALCHPPFILGWTFRGARVVERKTYFYPRRQHWTRLLRAYLSDTTWGEALAADSVGLAIVVSREGTPRLQFDVDPRRRGAVLRTLGNAEAIRITRLCGALASPLQLDTVGISARGLAVYFD